MATIKDIANRCGVSIATVSRALNGNEAVDQVLRRKVLRAAKDLDYKPNRLARGLKLMKTNVVGLLLPRMTNPFFPAVAEAFEATAMHRGYQVILCNTHWNEQRERQHVNTLQQLQVDGIVLLPSSHDILPELLGTAHVLIDKDVEGHISVRTDNAQGMKLAVHHLADLGHQRIALLGNISDDVKLRGFRQGHIDRSLQLESKLIFDTRDQVKSEVISTFLNALRTHQAPPSAVVGVSDQEAVMLLLESHRHNIRVPEDLAIVGYDNTFLAETSDLTSVSQPKAELGRLAAELLIDQIEGSNNGLRPLVLEPMLVVRRSTVVRRE